MDRPPPPSNLSVSGDVRRLRSEPRESMFLLATVRKPRGVDVAVKVRNLSPGGMMAECPTGFVRGEPIQIDLRGIGTVAGKIAWIASGRIGVQFDEPVDHRLARVKPADAPKAPVLQHRGTTWRPAVR